ncbi:Polypyrimidine tract-binding protein 2 [Sarracenia purpurea var. burkii]
MYLCPSLHLLPEQELQLGVDSAMKHKHVLDGDEEDELSASVGFGVDNDDDGDADSQSCKKKKETAVAHPSPSDLFKYTFRRSCNRIFAKRKRWRCRSGRGSEELLTHGTGAAVSNGNAISTHPGLVDNNNDAKKAKLDKSAGRPSKVIHLRNIPSEVSEAEIIHLGIPFGRVTNVLVLKGKNQVRLFVND